MLLADEYIIKFEEMYQKQKTTTWSSTPYVDYQDNDVHSAQESWKKFILEKLNKK
jgi:hypothetical protein